MDTVLSNEDRIFTGPVISAFSLCFGTAALILWYIVGPWEAVRHAAGGGLLAAGWLIVFRAALGGEPIPDHPPFRSTRLELSILLLALGAMVFLAVDRYTGSLGTPVWVYYLASYGSVLGITAWGRNGRGGLGLQGASRKAWLGVFAIILLNVLAGVIYQLLPQGEALDPPGADLSSEITTPLAALALFVGILVRAALPEELVLRAGIQPRLAALMPMGWAILIQALLFSTGHLPQQLLSRGNPLLLSLGYLLPLENGLIAGYVWYRTRSLPLLAILHLFAFPRFGI